MSGESDKVVAITLDKSGMPIPEMNRVKVKKGSQQVKWRAGFAFTIELDGEPAISSSSGGSGNEAKAGPFNHAVGTVIKYSITANGKTNDPEVEIEP